MYILLKCILTAFCLASLCGSFELNKVNAKCDIPLVVRGQWYSLENGRSITTEINATTMSQRGNCIQSMVEDQVNFIFVFQNSDNDDCYTCVKLIFRTINVLDKMESVCVTLNPNEYESLYTICQFQDTQINTLFSENYTPLNCRSSLEGIWQFAYQDRFRFTGECNNPESLIKSCQTAGTQFLTNEKFNITYKKCLGMTGTYNGVVEYTCLGDWFVDKNHFFAVVNSKESRKDEKYRCFLKNRDDDLYIGVSNTAECNTLQTVEKSPERLHISPVKAEIVAASCQLPHNFIGEWVNTANMDADVLINETHIIETWYPDEARFRRVIYVCHEQSESHYLMSRLTVDGCQKDYVCFDFMPRHDNIIRYRRGTALIRDNIHTVCSWEKFQNKDVWKYDILVSKIPVPIKCPVAGKFSFVQKGDFLFETRILGGITSSPRPKIICRDIISDFSVCDIDQKEITIDESFCLDLDYRGRPVDIYSDPDYRLHCIGYWKENSKSYLITYDPLDAASMYRCWVYYQADIGRIFMSQSIGSFCDLKQDAFSNNATERATVAIDMTAYERERDQCPMYFDDGENPWVHTDNNIQIL